MNSVKDLVRDFILTNHLQGESPDNLQDSTPLQSSGILDSLAVLGLVTFIEQRFGIEIEVVEASVDHFDRIEDIAALVGRKQRSQVKTV